MERILRWTFLLIAIAVPAWAQAPYDNSQTPEGWAWAQIKAGQVADFNQRPECGSKRLDPHEEAGWDNHCRQISPQFLIDILTVPKWRDQIRQSRVGLAGAHTMGDLDLAMTEIPTALVLAASRIEGNLDLVDARLKRLVALNGSVITGAVSAYRMHAESSFAALCSNHHSG
jgi:hypothetical protein